MSELIEWFKDRPVWTQYAAKQLIDSGEINQEDINKLVDLTIDEAKGEECEDISIDDFSFGQNSSHEIKINSLSEIEGINALSPKKPLEFGDENLSIIYGRNGSGKSGYVRILKHLAGSRNPGSLLSNVYKRLPAQQKCKVKYERNDQKQEIEWKKNDGSITDLLSIDIYDSSTGVDYLESQNEVTYEPPLLRFFSELINISQSIGDEIDSRINQNVSQKPNLPPDYQETELGKWYLELSSELDEEAIIEKVKWDDEKDEDEITKLKDRIGTEAPNEKANRLFTKRKRLLNFVLKTIQHAKKLSDTNCIAIIELKELLRKKEDVAETAAKDLFSSTPLDGIGSEVWVELWEKARTYSESIAYQDKIFPVIERGSKCVLCHQDLSNEAKDRFTTFEKYVKGETKKEAERLSKNLEILLEDVGDLPNSSTIITELDAIGLENKAQRDQIVQFYNLLRKRADEFKTIQKAEELTPLSNMVGLVNKARTYSVNLYIQAHLFLRDAGQVNREEIKNQLKELEVRKWLTTQLDAINSEVKRLSEVEILNKAKKLTNPISLSKKKGSLAEELITEAYINRFNGELQALEANNLKVSLKKTGVRKGQVLHEIQLKNIENQQPSEVLSEGERKIVSLAAFLADVTSKEIPAPFIFDDPITSLDEDFEDKVVDRLIDLSEKQTGNNFYPSDISCSKITRFCKKRRQYFIGTSEY